ncbi:MAG: N utilization substance protein B, partial [Limisphaerales bacterium]
MQTLFARYSNSEMSLTVLERQLKRSVRDAGRLYIFHFVYLAALGDKVRKDGDIKGAKFLPSEEDKKFSMRFYHNSLIQAIRQDEEFDRIVEREKLGPLLEDNMVDFGYKLLKKSEAYIEYLAIPIDDSEKKAEADKQVVLRFITEDLWLNEDFSDYLEDAFPCWDEDLELVIPRVRKSIKNWNPSKIGDWSDTSLDLLEESRDFVLKLLQVSVRHETELEELIKPRLENWDLDRVSLMDRILIRMA